MTSRSASTHEHIESCPICSANKSLTLTPGGWYACNSCYNNFNAGDFYLNKNLPEQYISDGNHYYWLTTFAGLISSVFKKIIFISITAAKALTFFIFISFGTALIFSTLWAIGMGLIGLSYWFVSKTSEGLFGFITPFLAVGGVIGFFHSIKFMQQTGSAVGQGFAGQLFDNGISDGVTDMNDGTSWSNDGTSWDEPSVNIDGSPMIGGIDIHGNTFGVTDNH